VPSTVNAINQLRNTLQYRDNDDDSHRMQADCLTTVLRCRASVVPGVMNTVRLAVADIGDALYESWPLAGARCGVVSARCPRWTAPCGAASCGHDGAVGRFTAGFRTVVEAVGRCRS
jgi:hypothetical protein